MTDTLKHIVDLGEFRARVEQVEREGKLPAEDHEALAAFLDAWRRQEVEKTLTYASPESVDT